jgi:hypothetical protein
MLWYEKQVVVAKVHTKSHGLLALKENCPYWLDVKISGMPLFVGFMQCECRKQRIKLRGIQTVSFGVAPPCPPYKLTADQSSASYWVSRPLSHFFRAWCFHTWDSCSSSDRDLSDSATIEAASYLYKARRATWII